MSPRPGIALTRREPDRHSRKQYHRCPSFAVKYGCESSSPARDARPGLIEQWPVKIQACQRTPSPGFRLRKGSWPRQQAPRALCPIPSDDARRQHLLSARLRQAPAPRTAVSGRRAATSTTSQDAIASVPNATRDATLGRRSVQLAPRRWNRNGPHALPPAANRSYGPQRSPFQRRNRQITRVFGSVMPLWALVLAAAAVLA